MTLQQLEREMVAQPITESSVYAEPPVSAL